MTMLVRALRSQWVKLRRPAVLVGVLGASLAFSVLATVVTFLTATDGRDTVRGGPGLPSSFSRAELAQADGVLAGLAQADQFLGIVALVLGAFAVAAEYQHGTLRNLLVRQPRRLILLAGSGGAAGLVLVAGAALAGAAAVAAAFVAAPGADVATSAWSAGEVVTAVARTSVLMLGYGLLGAVLGLVLRSPVAAIGAGVAYVLPVESILAAISGTFENLLPGRLLSAVGDGSASAANVTVLAGWVLVGLAVAGTTFLRRDVAA